MILRFLRLFRIFRELEARTETLIREKRTLQTDLTFSRAAFNEAQSDKLRLQDRLDAALADKDHLWNIMQDSLNNERNALRMQVNHAVQKAGGGIPYPDAHSLPAEAVRPLQTPGPVGRSGRQLPSEVLARHNNRAIEEIVGSFDPANRR